MDYENAESCGANEPHVDCSDAFKTSQVFECREDVLRWARSVANENGFVAVILRSNTNTGSRGRTTFVLIGCERSDEYRCRKKEFIRRDTGTRKCGCPFKFRCKPAVGGEGWMVKLICGVHNQELAKSLVGHPYARRLTKAEKTLIADMTKSMVKPRNILLTLKEHNVNSCTTIKQIYNARSAFRSSIRGSDLEMQHLMKLLERDQYIHWHRIKDEDVVPNIFWCHLDSVKLVNACNLNPSSCGCVVRTTLGLPCACELSKYVGSCIPLDSIHMFWRRLSFLDQGLSEPEVGIKDVMETISKKFEELDVCGKFTLRTKLWEIAYPDQNSMCPPPAKVNTKRAPKKTTSRIPRSTKCDPSYWEYVDGFESMQNSNSSVRRTASSSEQPNRTTMMPMLDQFQPFMHDFIDKIVDVKADGNCGYRPIAGLLGMGEDSWSVVRNNLLKELANFSEDYIKLFGGTERFEELRMSLLVDGLTKVTTDKWMDITDMGHVYLKERCPLLPIALLWSSNYHPQAKSWPNPYISRMQHYKSFVMFKRDYVDINDD
ncbi:hypothetical protein GmHk_16G046096 [Glycine max]|nr:hypothetical protein GmHk_16G046096 [Glycine max]